jgi:hypothetical protein
MASRAHTSLAVITVALVAVAVLGWKRFGSVDPRRPQVAIPNPQVVDLLPYAKPLPESLIVRPNSGESIVLRRDPFVSQPLSQIARARTVASVVDSQPKPRTVVEDQWRVSATISGGRRPAAIINDVLIFVGDVLPGGMKLTSVEPDRVVLTDTKGTAHTVAVREGER